MSRKCAITGSRVRVGNNVSHANNKTKRKFMPNMQRVSLLSDALGTTVTMSMSVRGLKTVEHNGGLDAYLLATPNRKLTPSVLALKKSIQKVIAKKAAN